MATRYVRQSAAGSNNGTDWTNAYTSLSGATYSRGDLIYVADGSYAGHTFNTAVSGTATIELRKATVEDHGTSTGWDDTYGDGQAIVTSNMLFYTSYWIVNGQSRNSDWQKGTISQYGFKINGCRLDNGSGSGGSNLTFTYCDLHGDGRDSGNGDDVIYSLVSNSNVTFQSCSLRDSDRTIWINAGGLTNWVIDRCYIARNTSSAAVHGEMWSVWGTATTVQFSFNVVEDITGTAIIAGINDGTMSEWDIYGNVFKYTDAGASHQYTAIEGTEFGLSGARPGTANDGVSGFIFVANDVSNNNFGDNINVYNNSFHGINGNFSGVIIQAGTGSNEVRNNMWYDCVATGHNFTGTISHNWYYLTTSSGDSSGTKQTGSSNLFTDADTNDYSLTAATDAGFSLSSPFNVDRNGVTRGSDGMWDRGAFEFAGGGASGGDAGTNAGRIMMPRRIVYV